MKKILVIVVLVLLCVAAFFILRPGTREHKKLIVAEELMKTNLDSSLVILKGMDGEHLKGENKALHALLLTQAQFKKRITVESDSTISIALDYYADRNDPLRKAQAYLYAARVDENMDNNNEALEYYQKAALAASETENYNLLALIYNRWGLLFQKQRLFDDALQKLQESLDYSRQTNDEILEIFNLKEIGKVYSLDKKYDDALGYYKVALDKAYRLDNKVHISLLCNNLGIFYKNIGDYDEAMYYANKSIATTKDSAFMASNYLLKGDIFTLEQQYDSARYYLNKGRKKSKINSSTYNDLMSKLEESTNNYKASLEHSKQYIALADTIVEEQRSSELAKLQRIYDYRSIKDKNAKLEQEKESMYYIALIIILVVIIIISMVSHKLAKTKREKKELFRKSYEELRNMEGILNKKQLEMILTKQKSDEEIAGIKEWILSRHEVIKKIRSLNEMKVNERIANKAKLELTRNEEELLFDLADACYDNLVTKLNERHPGLTHDNVVLCCLMKMRVPNPSISILLNVSDTSLEKRRSRLKNIYLVIPPKYSSVEQYLDSL